MKYLLLTILLLASSAIAQSTQESHLCEAGTSAIFQRSAFAHGYRHGYEDGYHLGNVDINLGRRPRAKLAESHSISSRYSPQFGSRKSFAAGFQDGLKAGYHDGFAGRNFRAVKNLRSIANSLDQNSSPADPLNVHFDQGVLAGYNDGRSRNISTFSVKKFEPVLDGCDQVQNFAVFDVTAQRSFCDGYRRGHFLGVADALAGNPDSALAARK